MSRENIRNVLNRDLYPDITENIMGFRHTLEQISNLVKGIPNSNILRVNVANYEGYKDALVYDVGVRTHLRHRRPLYVRRFGFDLVVLVFIDDLEKVYAYLRPISSVLNLHVHARTLQVLEVVEDGVVSGSEPYLEVLLNDRVNFTTPVIVRLFIADFSRLPTDMGISWELVDRSDTFGFPYDEEEDDSE